MEKIAVTVKLFGMLRTFAEGAQLSLDLPTGATVADLRSELKVLFAKSSAEFQGELLDSSAIGTEERILESTDHLREGDVIALLPPVCGG